MNKLFVLKDYEKDKCYHRWFFLQFYGTLWNRLSNKIKYVIQGMF